jgi:hypothetical protein
MEWRRLSARTGEPPATGGGGGERQRAQRLLHVLHREIDHGGGAAHGEGAWS